VRHGLLTSDAYAAAGYADSARAALEGLAQRFPENQAVRQAIERLIR
jgi:hypothetical protein